LGGKPRVKPERKAILGECGAYVKRSWQDFNYYGGLKPGGSAAFGVQG
jgi:hypothetical protein